MLHAPYAECEKLHVGLGNKDSPQVVAETQVASHDVFEQANSLRLHKLIDHVAQNRSNRVKPFVCVADVGQAGLVKQDLLDNEDGDRLGEFGSSLHDSKAERDDFRRE